MTSTQGAECVCDSDDGCGMTDLPVSLRPYWCREVTDAMRRTRDSAVEIVGEGRGRYGIVPKGRPIHPAQSDGPEC